MIQRTPTHKEVQLFLQLAAIIDASYYEIDFQVICIEQQVTVRKYMLHIIEKQDKQQWPQITPLGYTTMRSEWS